MRALVRPIVTAALLASVALLAPRASGQDKAPPTAPPSQPAPAAPKATPKLDDKPASPKAAPATPPATAPATPPAATPPVASGAAVEYVKMSTSMGDVIIELNREKAPLSVENFLSYVDKDYYAGTIFHRVIKTFMIQGGGFTADLTQKSTDKPIKNEWQNGPEERAWDRGHGPHPGAGLGDQPVLHQRRRQRLPRHPAWRRRLCGLRPRRRGHGGR
jgi:hypothetical protein